MLPKIQKFPAQRVVPGQPTCDSPPDHSFHNMSVMAAVRRHINSARFMSPHLPGSSVRGPSVKMANNHHEEYKYLAPPENAPDKIDLFSFDNMVQSLSLGLLKLLFIVLDIIILVYRCSRTFMVARTLCQGFDETRMLSGKEAKNKLKEHKKMDENRLFDSHRTAESSLVDRDYTGNATEYNIPDYMTNIESQRSMLPPPVPNCSNNTQNGSKMAHHYGATSSDHSAPWGPASAPKSNCKDTILRILQSATIPKIVMGIIIVVLFCFIVDAVLLLFSADMMADMHAFQMFLVGLDVQVNRTNWYLSGQAKHFNTITMNIYKRQMTSELLHFQSMVEYFNAGKIHICHSNTLKAVIFLRYIYLIKGAEGI